MKTHLSANVSWRLGSIGPMVVALNYTWLPVGGLALAVLAVLWLPDYAGGSPPQLLWLVASLILIVFAACLLLAEAARTQVAGIFSRYWPRSVQLFPFGAVAAYPPVLQPARAAMTALAAPVVLALFGLGFWGASALAELRIPGIAVGSLRALAAANIGVALLNLLPGVPLAGGWALLAAIRMFGSRSLASAAPSRSRLSTGQGPVRILGLLIVLLSAGAAVVEATSGRNAIAALSFGAFAWTVGEAWRVVTTRGSVRQALEQLSAQELMQLPAGSVSPGDNLAAVMWKHRKLPETAVLSVFDEQARFVGLLPLILVDHLLQGKWPTRRVADLMLPASSLPAVAPSAPLPVVLATFAREMPDLSLLIPSDLEAIDPLAVACVPVIDKDALCGVLCWRQVEIYQHVGAKAGVAEALALLNMADPSRRQLAWRGLAVIFVLGVLLLSAIVRGAPPAAVGGNGNAGQVIAPWAAEAYLHVSHSERVVYSQSEPSAPLEVKG